MAGSIHPLINPRQLGTILQSARKAQRLTQTALAERVGMSQSRISWLEKHAHWSPFTVKLAMALPGKNRHYRMHNIQRRHFNSTARIVHYGSDAEPLIEEILGRTPAVIAQVAAELPAGFSDHVATTILGGLETSAAALAAMSA